MYLPTDVLRTLAADRQAELLAAATKPWRWPWKRRTRRLRPGDEYTLAA